MARPMLQTLASFITVSIGVTVQILGAQLRSEDLETNEPVDNENNGEDDNAKNDGTPVKSRATRHLKANKVQGPKPTQMGYYSGAWVDVLKDAKNLYRLHLHTTDPFPEHDLKTLQDAHDCLLEAITTHESSAVVAPLEESKYNDIPFHHGISLTFV